MASRPPRTGDEFPTVNTLVLRHLVQRYYPYNLLLEIFRDDFHAVMHAYPDNLPEAMRCLDDAEKDVLVGNYYYGKPYREIAAGRGVTVERISQIRDKAVRKLRQPHRLATLTSVPLSDLDAKDAAAADLRTRCDTLEARLADHGIDASGIPVPPSDRTLGTYITETGLSVRAVNCLRRRNIDTLADLTAKTAACVRNIRNLGPRTFEEIHDMLLSHGLDFAPEN